MFHFIGLSVCVYIYFFTIVDAFQNFVKVVKKENCINNNMSSNETERIVGMNETNSSII